MNQALQKKSELLQDRFGLKTAFYLSSGVHALPYDISERLRAARMQALAQRKIAKPITAMGVTGRSGTAALTWGSDESLSWWGRVGVVFPLIALVVGLMAISTIQDDNSVRELAEVDAALLTDELPPAAFADPGFVQFLRSTRQSSTVQ